MKYKIIWSNFAEYQLDEIFNYYAKVANVRVAKNIVSQIRDRVKILEISPLVGEREELLKNRKESYRRLIVTNYKLIYSVDDELGFVKIADVFDTRQNPSKLHRKK